MGIYAGQTAVSAERSKGEIEATLRRYGATGFQYATDATRAMVAFQMKGKVIRFLVPMPQVKDYMMSAPDRRGYTRRRTPAQAEGIVEQETRQRWRALALGIKAKLETVSSGITQFEAEFLAHFVLPGGKTVAETLLPELEALYKSGKAPTLGWDGPK